MKKRIIAALLSLSIVAGFCSCKSSTQTSDVSYEATVSASSDAFSEAEDETVTLSNGKFNMNMDSATGRFILYDSTNGYYYESSVPRSAENEEYESHSEISVGYYDSSNRENYLYSELNALSFGNIKVLKNDHAVRVIYTFRLEKAAPFVPEIMSTEMFNSAFGSLSSADRFKVKFSYTLYKAENDTVAAREAKSKYEYAKDHDVYILKSSISNTDKNALAELVEASGYTNEKYLSDLSEINIAPDDADIPVSFTVPVEYSLTEKGFSAQILTDKIETTGSECTLQSVKLLPYFRAVNATSGYMFVPDGSGAVIDDSIIDDNSCAISIYGNDTACIRGYSSSDPNNGLFGVFGYSTDAGSFMTCITDGAEFATVKAARKGTTNPFPHVYSQFALKTVDDYEARKGKNLLVVFSNEFITENPKEEYIFLSADVNVAQMAAEYKQYLFDNKKIKNNQSAKNNNTYLEFTCCVTVESSFLGIPYDKKIVLTKISSVIDDIQSLVDNGMKNIYVRLVGFGSQGKYHGITDSFQLEKGVGSIEELKKLAEILNECGGQLYLEDDIFAVYKDTVFDGFSASNDAVRRLDKTQGYINDFDLVSLNSEKSNCTRYLLTPSVYFNLAQKFTNDMNKKVVSDNIGVSSSEIGRRLISDFNTKKVYNRAQSCFEIEKSIALYCKNNSFMTDYGNAYTLPYAEHILNTPLTHSGYSVYTISVPFYSLVLSGSVSVAGNSLNGTNSNKNMLNTLINCASPYWSCVTQRDALTELKRNKSLSVSLFDTVKDDILKFYTENKELYELNHESDVVSYTAVQNGLIQKTYRSGKSVYFNLTANDIVYNGKTVPSKGYSVLSE